MSIVLTGELRDAALAATGEEGVSAHSVRAIFGGANWIIIAILTPSGVTVLSIGPEDPLWPVLFEMLGGAKGAGPEGDFDNLVISVAANSEGDFEPMGNHGRARLVLDQGDVAARDIRAASDAASDAADPGPSD